MEKLKNLLERGVEEMIVKNDLESALKSKKKLRIKLGIDPTSPDLHLGHSVVLRKLKQFQDLGHKIILIIGDFTAQIGDPSGRSETRKPLAEKEIKQNFKNYLMQASKIIDVKKTEIRYNSEWLKKNGLDKFLEIARGISIQQLLEREDFQKRFYFFGKCKNGHKIKTPLPGETTYERDKSYSHGGSNKLNCPTCGENIEPLDQLKGTVLLAAPISTLEILYPLLQGYDSVAMKADVEIGGTDQKFNLLMGRRIQRHFGIKEQNVITIPLLEGTDGIKKMSKSYGNYIGINETPKNMFGKIMAVPDKLIRKYFSLLTDIDKPENLNNYEAKILLAETIVSKYHSVELAKKAKEEFIKTFSKKEIPEEIQSLKVKKESLKILDLLICAGITSKSEARRLIEQKAIEINNGIKINPNEKLHLRTGDVLKIGKKRFYKISLN